jgi:hypothetical protein
MMMQEEEKHVQVREPRQADYGGLEDKTNGGGVLCYKPECTQGR